MFGRYTERAQKAMNLAQEEARRLGWDMVDTSHLFLGLIREGNGLAAVALQNLGLDLDVITAQVDRLVGRGEGSSSHDLEFTPRAIRVLTEDSVAISRQLSHNYVGTEHILLALLQDGEGSVAQTLATLDVSPADVRSLLLASPPPGEAPVGSANSMAQQVRDLAQDVAREMGQPVAGTEHVLLALLQHGGGKATELLRRRGITVEWLRAELARPAGDT